MILESIFSGLYNALNANLAIAMIASFVWGMMSILLSPCHLSGIPLMIGFLTGKQVLSLRTSFRLSLVFSLGILFSIALIGLITALMGRMMGDLGTHANLVFGIAIIIGGILLADIIPLGNISFLNKVKVNRNSNFSVFTVGLLFGMALGPCAFAFMAPVLTLVFSLAKANLFPALAIISLYALGHCLVIVAAGTSFTWVQRLLNWNERSRYLFITKKVCAILVIFAGIYLIIK